MRSGNFRVSSRTWLIVGLSQDFLLFIKLTIVEFPILFFSFFRANWWVSVANFSIVLLGEIFLGPWQRLGYSLFFQDSTLCESISKVISLSCRMSSLEGLRILRITKVVVKSKASSNLGILLILFQMEVRKPHCFCNIPKSQATPKTYLLRILGVLPLAQNTSQCACVLSLSDVQLFVTLWTVVHCRLLCPCDFPNKNTGVGCHFLLQRVCQPMDWTHVSCISCVGRWILYPWATWDTPQASARA